MASLWHDVVFVSLDVILSKPFWCRFCLILRDKKRSYDLSPCPLPFLEHVHLFSRDKNALHCGASLSNSWVITLSHEITVVLYPSVLVFR